MITLSGRGARFGSGFPAVVTVAVEAGPARPGSLEPARALPAPLEGWNMKALLPVALAALPLAATGAAQAQSFDLGEIVVSPNLEPTAINKVGATVEVVDRAALDQAPQGSVAQALAFVPGLTVSSNGGLGQNAGFQLRGANQNYVPVLIDGIDVTDPSAPQVAYNFGQLTTAGIGAIEVLQGSQSALYGSSAIGGVIDIQSRKATEPGLHFYTDAEIGSRQSERTSATGTLKTQSSDLAVTLSQTGTAGYPVFVGAKANGRDDGYHAARIAMNGSHTFANGVKLGFAGFAEANHGDYDPQAGVNAWANQKSDTAGLRLYAQFTTGKVENTLSVTTFRVQRAYTVSPAATGYTLDYVGTRQKLAYQGAVGLGARARLVFGADSSRERMVNGGSYGTTEGTRRITGLFSELSYSPTAALDLTAALRNDHETGFGNATTGRLALAWRPAPGWTLRASAGTGFRAPSPYELHSLYGSSTLKAEKSRSADLGVERDFANGGMIRATAFLLSVDNLIGYDSAATSCQSYALYGSAGCYAQIRGTSRRSGVELEGRTKIGRATLAGAYTYTQSATSAGTNWAAVPRQVVSARLSLPVGAKWTLEASALSAMDRQNGLPDYAVAGAGVNYQVNERVEAYLRVENLFNTAYQQVKNYAMPGRAVYVGVRARF